MTKRTLMITLIFAATISLTPGDRQNLAAQKSTLETDLVTVFTELFANQPDHSADIHIMIADPSRMKIARKQGKVRMEWLNPVNAVSRKVSKDGYYSIFMINRPDRPYTLFDPQLKTYAEMPEGIKPPAPEMLEMFKEMAKSKPELKCTVEDMGAVPLDGHRVNKLRIRSSGNEPPMFVYVARDLKNLLVKFELTLPYPPPNGTNVTYTLSNVTLDVPDSVFEMPAGYRKVDHQSFIETFKRNTAR
jgi:hypothetical protein